ncbi:MAG: sulfatase-like hydrolase/transferase [Lachnospiraceae bacterium]|nr:sulfatase-like hydrolase/transferase [Lachnospiraceae bacterium]
MWKKWLQKLVKSDYLKVEKHPYLVWIGSSVIMELILEILSRKSFLDTAVFVLDSPVIFLINVLIIMALYSLMFLSRKTWFVHGVITTVLLLVGVVDFILLLFRTTPLTAQDLFQIESALRVMEHYISWFVLIPIAAFLIGLAIALVWGWRKAPRYHGAFPWKRNITLTAVSMTVLVILFSGIIRMTILPDRFSNIGKAYQDYGLVYCFITSMVNTGIDKPESYSGDEVEQILEQDVVPERQEEIVETEAYERIPETGSAPEAESGAYAGADEPDEPQEQLLGNQNGAANVIFLQLESFYDVTKLSNVELSEDPMPYIRKLEKQYSTGFLSVPCVGAGTANTEFEIMTGMNLDFFGPGEYPYQTVLQNNTCESLGFIFHDLGYTSHAIHNNSAYFYDRYQVFSQLGYDTFTSIEYMKGIEYTETGWAKDKLLTGCILDALRDTKNKDYIYTISVQGHGDYPEDPVLVNPAIIASVTDSDGEYSEGQSRAYTYYVNQLKEMDTFVSELIAALKEFGEPTVLVLYGDHLPSLGIEAENMEEGNMFQTKYVIWNNFGLERQVRDVEAYQLGAVVMSDISISEGILFRYHQNYFVEQPADDTEYLDKMAMIGYDMLYGEQKVYDGANPYAPSTLQMGIHPVWISDADYDETSQMLTITGKNFNEFSIAVVNGRQYKPTYWSDTKLVVENVEGKGTADICVAQMDDYSKTILSTTLYYRMVMTRE